MEENKNKESDKIVKNPEGSIALSDMLSAIFGGQEGIAYRGNVIAERDKLIEALNSFAGTGRRIDTLKGDIAEYWHAGTFNLNAVQRGSSHRVFVPRSNDFASPDILSNFGKTFGSKYYKTGEASAKQQAKSIYERFTEYRAKGGKDSVEVFLHDRNYELCNVNDPMYIDQIRIIPSDQIEEARSWLNRMIKIESARRPEQAERYRETLKMLDDRVRDGKGTESIVLTKGGSERIAKLSKEEGVTPASIMLTDADIIKINYVMKNAAKAGLEAAAISAAISLVLNVYNKYKTEGKQLKDYELKDWQDIFGKTVFSAGTAAISATTLYVIGSYCEAAVPGVGALLMAVFGIAALIPDYVDGKLTTEEFIVEAEIICIDAAIIMLGTIAFQAAIPVPGLGALVGALAGSIAIMIIEYLWGEELRDVLAELNKRVKSAYNKASKLIVKEIGEVGEDIVLAFQNCKMSIDRFLDEDFNSNVRYLVRISKRDVEAERADDLVFKEENVYE
ncbi:MAG: hypothetical protein E7306_05175 [Butyrivibrio sp.]|nr:hypothetical protein [Butyrivibrio sp.]